jgi:SAM-dependent methyltransferase
LCGHLSLFLQLSPGSFREGLTCAWCRSPSRKRHVALVLRDALGHAELTAGGAVRAAGAEVLSTQTGDALSASLSGYAGFHTSDLVPGRELGSVLGPRSTCQDLERLTFEDGSFDVVLTEDVLEHVRRPDQAFAEIRRVLRPGGRHIFTIPYLVDRATVVRVDTTGDEDVHLLPPEYHGDPLRGQILAYRTFGTDLLAMLDDLGFGTSLHLAGRRESKAGVYDSIVFASTRSP